MKGISSLWRQNRKENKGPSPFSSPLAISVTSPLAARRSSLDERRRPAAGFREEDPLLEDEASQSSHGDQDLDGAVPASAVVEEDGEDEDHEGSPLLPIFSAAHLDSLPVYNLTHAIRLLVIPRCETTLSWDQLRSPQVSQFLVKPIQQQIRSSHFSRATLYALISNTLQFSKEVHLYPGNSGASRTRALVCELLAIKLLREYTTRELIDALSYDFHPLQGLVPDPRGNITPGPNWDSSPKAKELPRAARVSTLEVAIRAQAKRFLAHPLVVQQLEAIWAGTIVFHSAADNLHRAPTKLVPNQNRGYGTSHHLGKSTLQASFDRLQPAKQRDHVEPVEIAVRRSATLYDPREASLFKLSRLRVPRYRQFLSTTSYAVLLALYLAVLMERSLHISSLEVVFWFWSAGFMLDEIVGFNEQGFSLYILSFWNAFDLGILLLFVCYYCMRLYGILMPDIRKRHVAAMAYDTLAANAVLLFPRLFSVLDHYRYFSQLLIAFRMMAQDLVAILVLILISCSGFFVAFTLSFGSNDFDASGAAYTLFQILMGFTPAAWDKWNGYNALGKIIMTAFLCICHFLIVTILITVLTNSFMAIVQNANEEHQFVFAVNTISMVKSDALFSYIAPTNIFAWFMTPLRFLVPFRQYVRINRTVIKLTHFPVLFIIFAYERLILRSSTFEPTDLVEQRGRVSTRPKVADPTGHGLSIFSPGQRRLREPSVATYHKDKALEAVFHQPFRDNTIRGRNGLQRRKTSNAVNNWMQGMGPSGTASPPQEQDPTVLDRLETRRTRRRPQPLNRRSTTQSRNFTEATLSMVSEPEDVGMGDYATKPNFLRKRASDLPNLNLDNLPEDTDGDRDGDDELFTHDDDEKSAVDRRVQRKGTDQDSDGDNENDGYFQQTPTNKHNMSSLPSSYRAVTPKVSQAAVARTDVYKSMRRSHVRNASTNTVLYDPPSHLGESSSSASRKEITARNSARNTGTGSGARTPATPGHRTPKRTTVLKARPIMPPRSSMKSAPDLAGLLRFSQNDERRTFSMDIGSDIGDNKAIGGGFIGAVPASLATQMAFTGNATRANRGNADTEDQNRMSKLVLARMNNLEEGFRDILKEVKDWRKDETRSVGDGGPQGVKVGKRPSRKAPKGEKTRFNMEAVNSMRGTESDGGKGEGLQRENQSPDVERHSGDEKATSSSI